jgi:hypothetical protein
MDSAALAQRLTEIKKLDDNWDGEGAPKPSEIALRHARATISWAETVGIKITDVDADALGGVAVWIGAVWIADTNGGTTIVSGRCFGDDVPWPRDDANTRCNQLSGTGTA